MKAEVRALGGCNVTGRTASTVMTRKGPQVRVLYGPSRCAPNPGERASVGSDTAWVVRLEPGVNGVQTFHFTS